MQKPSKNTETDRDTQLNDDLQESLELLVDRDNPMADAAETALEIL